MSCCPTERTIREARLLRAFHHYVHRDHEFEPSRCAGCLEAAGFLTIPGYQGDANYPVCIAMYGDEEARFRDKRTSLKYIKESGTPAYQAEGTIDETSHGHATTR